MRKEKKEKKKGKEGGAIFCYSMGKTVRLNRNWCRVRGQSQQSISSVDVATTDFVTECNRTVKNGWKPGGKGSGTKEERETTMHQQRMPSLQGNW